MARDRGVEHLRLKLWDGPDIWWWLDEERGDTLPCLSYWDVYPIVVVYEILVLHNVCWGRHHLLLHGQRPMRVLMHLLQPSG